MQPLAPVNVNPDYPKIWNPKDEFPREKAETVLSKFGISKDMIQPLGKIGYRCGYTAVVDNIRYIFQGVIEKEGEMYAQHVDVHTHDREEVNTVRYGAGHFYKWIDGVQHHEFVKAGESIKIPALVPHCVVAGVLDTLEGKQYGLVISRENQENPQKFPEKLPEMPEPFLGYLKDLEA